MSRFLLLLLALGACRGDPAPQAPPERLEEARRLTGDATRGFGAAVAFVDGSLRVGMPWHGPGEVWSEAGPVLTGQDGDRLGETLLGGGRLIAGSPGRGEGGALVDASGAVVLAGAAGERLGGAPVQHGDEVVAIGLTAVVGAGSRWEPPGPLWSLVSLDMDGQGPVLVGGLVSGGVAWPGSVRAGSGALGRGLLACDLDGDGDDELIVADPLDGRVQVHAGDLLRLDAPDHELVLGPGAGRTLACLRGGLLVGAPDASGGGALAWVREPLRADPEDAVWIRGGAGSRLGHALAVHEGQVAVGDPGRGEVRVLVGAD